MKRVAFEHDGLLLSYLDTGGDGYVLIALHAYGMEASTFSTFAANMAPEWRVIALDQRGHGRSSHAKSCTREDYLGDIEALVKHLDLYDSFILLGHALGGINAYRFAARHLERVRALIVVDIGTDLKEAVDFIVDRSDERRNRGVPNERDRELRPASIREFVPGSTIGRALSSEPKEIAGPERRDLCCPDWTATDCPALLIRGAHSRLTTAAQLSEMAGRRHNTKLVTLQTGHFVHLDDPEAFETTVRAFVEEL